MLDPAGKSLYLQAWWYRGWSGLGPNAPIPLPIIPAFQDASCNNVLPSPQPWHWERAWVLCVATLTKTDRGSARPRGTGNQHMGSSSLQWRVLCSISDPDLNSAPCAQEVQAELLGCGMLLPQAGNWVSSWKAVCLCRVTRFLSRREMLNFCTSVCRIRTLSD